ncbi:MAG: hypothetical protein JRD92_07970 [Deltaproteobacteria bacterium]|nr:hypothetical protein [Deltaproteobacteria bacterium]
MIAFVLEAGVLLVGVAIYARHARSKLPIWIFSIVLLGIQYSNTLLPLPDSTRQFAVMALASYFGFAAAAWFVERKWGQQPDSGGRWDTLHPGAP